MKNFKLLLICIMGVLFVPTNIFAASSNDKVGYDLTKYQCTGEYQDHNISTTGEAYFSHCIIYSKNNSGRCTYEYYDNEKVNCLNGNRDPYYENYKDGCSNYSNKSCNDNKIRYCSVIIKYDCSRKSDGSSFTTTTKSTTTKKTTKRTTSKTTTTTEIMTIEPSSTKLKSLSLSKGSIAFNSDIFEYSLTLNQEDTFVNITAVPENDKCKVEVKNNTNLVDGSVISIIVKSPVGDSSEYKINVKKAVKLSNNANLKNLTVTNYELSFNSKILDYTIMIDENTKELDINYEVEDDKSTVLISNNSNLTNGSKVNISVTAEDGTVKNYYINIRVKEKSNSLGIIFIIILVLAIIAGAYYLYKKFIASKAGEKYEYE